MLNYFSKEQNKALFEAQSSLNIKYTGEDWMNKVPISHFIAAMQAEYGELLESSPRTGDETKEDMPKGWKWWKPYLENDDNNNIVEAVDMIHFAMSAMIIRCGGVDGVIEELDKFEIDHNDIEDESYKATVLIGATCGFSISSLFSENLQEIIGGWVFLVDALCKYCDMTPDTMVKYYFKKNELNSERIAGGYTKDADSYEKYDADGNEDNTKMFD